MCLYMIAVFPRSLDHVRRILPCLLPLGFAGFAIFLIDQAWPAAPPSPFQVLLPQTEIPTFLSLRRFTFDITASGPDISSTVAEPLCCCRLPADRLYHTPRNPSFLRSKPSSHTVSDNFHLLRFPTIHHVVHIQSRLRQELHPTLLPCAQSRLRRQPGLFASAW